MTGRKSKTVWSRIKDQDKEKCREAFVKGYYRSFLHSRPATIIPAPETPAVSSQNDCRPVALTRILINCFEKLVLQGIRNNISASLEPHWFIFGSNRSKEDAISLLPCSQSSHTLKITTPTLECSWLISAQVTKPPHKTKWRLKQEAQDHISLDQWIRGGDTDQFWVLGNERDREAVMDITHLHSDNRRSDTMVFPVPSSCLF